MPSLVTRSITGYFLDVYLNLIQTNFDIPLLIYVKLIKLLERGVESDSDFAM